MMFYRNNSMANKNISEKKNSFHSKKHIINPRPGIQQINQTLVKHDTTLKQNLQYRDSIVKGPANTKIAHVGEIAPKLGLHIPRIYIL